MPNNIINVPMTSGVDLLRDPRRIRDDQLVACSNLIPTKPGILETRPSAQFLNIISTNATPTWPLGMKMVPFESLPFDVVYATRDVGNAENTLVFAAAFDQPSSLIYTDLGGVTAYCPSVVPFRNKFYVFGGASSAVQGKVLQNGVGGTPEWATFEFAGTGNSSITPAVAGTYRNRMLYGNLAPGYESALLLSDTGEPDVIGDDGLAANGRNFYAGNGDGDRIVAIKEMTQSSVAVVSQSACLILKQNSAFILTGEPTQSTAPFNLQDFTVSQIAYPCGCASEQTLVQTPYGLIWASHDDVWMFVTGALPIRIGSNIRPALLATPANLRYKWHATYFEGFYRLAMFADGQGPNDDSPCAVQYWLDLRNGPPQDFTQAQWWGPHNYNLRPPSTNDAITTYTGTWCMDTTAKLTQEQQLYAITPGLSPFSAPSPQGHNMWLTGFTGQSDYDGYCAIDLKNTFIEGGYTITPYSNLLFCDTDTLVINNGNMYRPRANGTTAAGGDGPTGYIPVVDGSVTFVYVGPSNMYAPTFDSAAGAINVEITTKMYDFSEPMIRKMFQGAELDIRIQNDCEVAWTAIIDGGGTISSGGEDLSAYGFQADLSLLNTDVMTRQFQSVNLKPSSSTRPDGKIIQLNVTNAPGYVVIEGYNDKFVYAYAAGGGDPSASPLVATLAPGYYADYSDLLSGLSIAPLFSQLVCGAYSMVGAAGGSSVMIWTDGSKDASLGLTAGVSRRTAVMLGFEADQILSCLNSQLPGIQTANAPRFSPTPGWEIGGLTIKVRAIPRRPA